MSDFFGRKREINELQTLADQPGSQFLIRYGRRRVGKTTLALQWVRQSGLPTMTIAVRTGRCRLVLGSGCPGRYCGLESATEAITYLLNS